MAAIKFQRNCNSFLILSALCALRAACAAVPLEWIATPQRPAPATFDRFHGESLVFRCTFSGFGALPFDGASDVRLWYQTNGMGAAWWSLPATVSTNTLTAIFTPDLDPGADRLSVFFGAPSNAYAAAQVRFRNSPGATPNDLAPPSILDWQAELAAATNSMWAASIAAFMLKTNTYTKAETDARITELAPHTSLEPATNYANEVVAALSNAVPVMVMNETAGTFSEWTYSDFSDYDIMISEQPEYQYGCWGVNFMAGGPEWASADGSEDATQLTFSGNGYSFNATRTYTPCKNAIRLARLRDITNTVTKAYVEGLGIEAGISAENATNIAESVVNVTVTGVVRAVSFKVKDYIFDPVTEVCWRRQMVDGFLDYIAVTNIDVTLPENYEALEALERRDNQ